MADEEKDIEGEEEGGGGKKKLIIIIAAVVLLLIIGGAAAFFLLGGEEEAEEGAEEEVAEEVVEAVEGEPLYLPVEPKFVINLPEGGPVAMLQVGVTIYTRHQEISDWLNTNGPMLRHHIINLLEEQDGAVLLTLEGKKGLQVAIKELLTKKLEEMRQPGDILDVYFTEFVLQ